MKAILIALLLTVSAMAQEGTVVNQTEGPPPGGYTDLFTYDGSNLPIYACRAKAIQPPYAASVAGATMTNIIVAANVGTVTWTTHGLKIGNRVTVAGATDADLNKAYYVQTTADANTFTITVADVSADTYTTGVTITTTAPRSTAAVWSILKYTYSGTNLISKQWASGSPEKMVNICANQAVTTGATMVTFQ